MTPSPQFKRCIVGMIVVLSVLIGGLVATSAHLSKSSFKGSAAKSTKGSVAKKTAAKASIPVRTGPTAPFATFSWATGSVFPLFASVQTNKADYHPGEAVIVTGSGWLAGEKVELRFDEDPVQHPPHFFYAFATGQGDIYNSEYVIE